MMMANNAQWHDSVGRAADALREQGMPNAESLVNALRSLVDEQAAYIEQLKFMRDDAIDRGRALLEQRTCLEKELGETQAEVDRLKAMIPEKPEGAVRLIWLMRPQESERFTVEC